MIVRIVQIWVKKHPLLEKQIIERFSLEQFIGLPLTLLASIFLLCIALLIGVIQDYLAHDPLIFVDVRVTNLMYTFRNDAWLRFFYFVTLLAESVIIIVLSTLLSIFLWVRRARLYICTLWFALMVGDGFTFFGKHLFQRTRPDVLLRAVTENTYSFPSGHATTVVLFYGFIAYLVVRNHRSWKLRMVTLTLLLVIVVLVDLSRIYLGVHYVSDVIAGNLVGFAALLLAIGMTEWITAKKPLLTPNKRVTVGVAYTLVLVVVFITIGYALSPPPMLAFRSLPVQHIDVRGVLLLFDKKVIPRFTETLAGQAEEPINLLVVSPERCFTSDMLKANWQLAESITLRSAEKLSKDVLLNEPYPTAPVTPSFYNAEPNDYGFEKQTETNSIRARHHARFWNTGYLTPSGYLYIGTVSLDTGIKWGITHHIAPDIDTDRDLLVSDLTQAGVVEKSELVQFIPPSLGKNFLGDQFFTNGKAALIVFRQCDDDKTK